MNQLEANGENARAIVLVPTACRDSQIDTGLSKFGGNPDLPDDFQINFDFQFFIGQINFAQIKQLYGAELLPPIGLLSLFSSRLPDNSVTVIAKYFASTDALKRILLPAKKHPCHPCRLTPYAFQSAPTQSLAQELKLQYEHEFLRRFYPHKQNLDFDTPWHQMLGFYRNIAQLEQTWSESDSKVLLLQIDSDSLVSMSWGYNGQLYFWIKRSDLLAKNFANLEVELAEARKEF